MPSCDGGGAGDGGAGGSKLEVLTHVPGLFKLPEGVAAMEVFELLSSDEEDEDEG